MSLEGFRRSKLVVLDATTTAYDAARAMIDNHVGAVLVAYQRTVTGIVTDRDLATKVVGRDRDPIETYVGAIMSSPIVAVPIAGSVDDVVLAMREHGCRRVLLTDADGGAAGLATLDDLLASGAIGPPEARLVLAAQLAQASRLKPEGAMHPPEQLRRGASRRHESRAEASYVRLLADVERRAGLRPRERAELGLRVSMQQLCRRLRPEDARRFLAQLPSRLRDELEPELVGPLKGVTLDAMIAAVGDALELGAGDAEETLFGICDAVADGVSGGDADAVRAHLPASMKDLFPARGHVRDE
jgi:CBS domain-containing protein/uncharacterized protein (DUF2267 family)